MKRKILRLWAEYESDESPRLFLEPISPVEAKKLIREFLDGQEGENKTSLDENISIQSHKGKRVNMKYISKERMAQIEETVKQIDREYIENPAMTMEDDEQSIMQDSW